MKFSKMSRLDKCLNLVDFFPCDILSLFFFSFQKKFIECFLRFYDMGSLITYISNWFALNEINFIYEFLGLIGLRLLSMW